MLEMRSSPALITAEEYMQLPDEDGFRHELINGEVIRMPVPGLPHARLQARLIWLLSQFVSGHELGEVFGELGFKLTLNPDTVLGPDVAFITKHRIDAAGNAEGFWSGPPDLAVEILSPSDRPGMVNARISSWFDYGVKQLWIVSPRKRTVTIYRSPSDSITFSDSDELQADDILPGFRLSLERIFGS